eukprot:gene9461-12747_t
MGPGQAKNQKEPGLPNCPSSRDIISAIRHHHEAWIVTTNSFNITVLPILNQETMTEVANITISPNKDIYDYIQEIHILCELVKDPFLITDCTKTLRDTIQDHFTEYPEQWKITLEKTSASNRSDLEKYFLSRTVGDNVVHKVVHYFDLYVRYFSKFLSADRITMIKIGVFSGGDQSNKTFLTEVLDKVGGPIDIILDDGAHRNLHTNYWVNEVFQEGLEQPHTFIEYSKKLVDKLNAFNIHPPSDKVSPDDFTRTTTGIYFHDSMTVFEKGEHTRYQTLRIGSKYHFAND